MAEMISGTPVQSSTLIIGAGPAGLAVAGRLSRLGLPYTLIEQSDCVCPAWRSHYDRLHLHTVKEFSHLPHKPFPEHYPLYVPKEKICAYFDDYCREMGIKPVFGETVMEVKRGDAGKWHTRTAAGHSYLSDRVVVCTGYNRVPNRPVWPGMEQYSGALLHSSEYRNGAPWKGKKVLVIGMGNTGAELAADLFEHGAEPSISIRGPVNIVLRDPFGRPAQRTSMLLRKLPAWLGDWIGQQVSHLTVGDLRPFGIKRPRIAPAAQLRRYGRTPVIDVGALPLIKQRKISILPAVRAFTAEGVELADGRSLPFDAVLLATGFRPEVGAFLGDTAGLLNDMQVPAALWNETQPGLYFLGFDAYANGILNHIHRDSERITQRIAAEAGLNREGAQS